MKSDHRVTSAHQLIYFNHHSIQYHVYIIPVHSNHETMFRYQSPSLFFHPSFLHHSIHHSISITLHYLYHLPFYIHWSWREYHSSLLFTLLVSSFTLLIILYLLNLQFMPQIHHNHPFYIHRFIEGFVSTLPLISLIFHFILILYHALREKHDL